MLLDNHILPFFISCNHHAVTPHFYRGSQAQDNTLCLLYCNFSDVTVGGQYFSHQGEMPNARRRDL